MGPSSSLKTHNTGLPVAQLPDEILLDIFKTYRARCYKLAASTVDPSRYDWLRVSQVCHYWRALFVDTPSMWSDISFPCHPTLSMNMLQRSGEAPLAIIGITNTWTKDEVVNMLAPQLHRVRRLELTTELPATEVFLRACASSPPNTHLTCLRVGLRVPASGFTFGPSGLLNGAGAPNMHTVAVIVEWPVSFQGWSFTARLEYLTVHSREYCERPPATDWSALLASAPHLRKLSLKNILPDTPAPQGIVTLSALTKLEVHDTPTRVAHLLTSIRTPAVRRTLLKCARAASGAGLSALTHALGAHLRAAADAPPFTELAYGESGLERPVRVHVELTAREDGCARVRRLDVEFRYEDADAPRVASVLGALPLGAVVEAELIVWGSGDRLPSAIARPDGEYAAWRTAFGGMRALEDLDIDSQFWKFPKEHFLGRDGLLKFFPRIQSLQIGDDLMLPDWEELQLQWKKDEEEKVDSEDACNDV
ncbi:F-box protein [Phanerochaete sordida]|uniref:F-box protein n=1 Tax=Phanerochaete sordida TaxID=48140 RepID=A0A9P3GJC3_9APHY|nr:F-box protein [Phanerochaete sordida]